MPEMEHAAWYIVGVMVSMGLGGLAHWLYSKDNCKHCGLMALRDEQTELKKDIKRLCVLVYELAQRAGMTLKEQLELQALEKE